MKLTISKTDILKRGNIELTTGMIGKTIDIEFAPDWNGLSKFAVFRNFIDDETPVVKENPTTPLEIPVEVLQKENERCYVGFYGYKVVNGVKTEAVPTIYTDLAIVKLGTDPNGNPAMDVPPSVAEQLVQDMTELGGRVTSAESELTDHEQRIEYLEEHGGGGGESYDDTELRNRITTIEGKEAGWNAKYNKPSGGIPKSDLASDVQTSLGRADTAVQPEAGKGLFSGNYNDLTNKPTIPEAVTDAHINSLIDAKLGVIENGSY